MAIMPCLFSSCEALGGGDARKPAGPFMALCLPDCADAIVLVLNLEEFLID
jgi:hypothetical protein